jgi:hypothetical protein
MLSDMLPILMRAFRMCQEAGGSNNGPILLHLNGSGIDHGHAGLVYSGGILDTFGSLVLDRLGVGQPDVGDEERDDERGGGDAHTDDDQETLSLVVGASDGDTLRSPGQVRFDERSGILVGGGGERRVGKIRLELSRDLVRPDACKAAESLLVTFGFK